MSDELNICPTCGALPCDQTNTRPSEANTDALDVYEARTPPRHASFAEKQIWLKGFDACAASTRLTQDAQELERLRGALTKISTFGGVGVAEANLANDENKIIDSTIMVARQALNQKEQS